MAYVIGTDEWSDAWYEAAKAAANALRDKVLLCPDLLERIVNMPFEDIPEVGIVPELAPLYELVDDIDARFDALNWFSHGRPESDEELIRNKSDLAGIVYLLVDLFHPDKNTL